MALCALAWLVGLRYPGIVLAHEVAERIVCAVRLTEDCRNEPLLRAANGNEVAALLRDHAPALLYEDGMTALPVDFRDCRSDSCAEGARSGVVGRTSGGLRVVAFTHVIDCRAGRRAATEARGGNCSGPRAGNLYLQYWLYYPGSATAEGSTPLRSPIRRLSGALGHSTYHPDDWEGYQVRVGRGGTVARASSHHGYNGWDPDGDRYYISGGSHAGRPLQSVTRAWIPLRLPPTASRTTRDGRLVLIPLETMPGRDRFDFAITPPWRKRVWFDPEYAGTD
ncbi:MAG TPA: hypothetical protein VLB79_07345 [Solirubrobacterales bacterium]|nr:hypothetical protein [Solirubrobacterales bacterium]